MEIYERIEIIRKKFFGNNIKFAEAMNEQPTTTSGWCSGKRNIGINVIQKILEKMPNISDIWLYTGKGSMLLPESENLSENKPNLAKQKKEEERLFSSKEVKLILNKQYDIMTEEFGKIIMEKMSGIVEGQLELLRMQVQTQGDTIKQQHTTLNNILNKIAGVEEKTGEIIKLAERKIG